MDIFTQRKLLVRIVVLLTVLNFVLIGFFLAKDIFHKPPPHENQNETPDVNRILKRELNLTNEQMDEIRKLRNNFNENEKAISSEIKMERDSINMLMFNKNNNEDIIISLARRVAENDYRMEMLRYKQAQEFKAICSPEQMDKFDGLVREIRDLFRADGQQPGKNENQRPRKNENKPPRNNENQRPR